MSANFFDNFRDAKILNMHYLMQKHLETDEFDRGYQDFLELLDKLEIFDQDEKIEKFLDFIWSDEETKKLKKLNNFRIELKQIAFFYSFYFIDQSYVQMWIALMYQHSQENPKIQRTMQDLEKIKAQEDSDQKNGFSNNFKTLIEKLIENLDISHRKFSLNIIFFLYHVKKENVSEFLKYYVDNIEEIYFLKQFDDLNLDQISTDPEEQLQLKLQWINFYHQYQIYLKKFLFIKQAKFFKKR